VVVTIPRGSTTRLSPLPELVLFDLDNTICDYDGARMTRTRYAFEPHFADVELLEAAVDAALASAPEGHEHFADVLAAHGISEPAAVEQVRERYLEDRYRGLRLFDGALDVIDTVRGVARVGLVTNGPTAIQRPKIDLLGIESRFPVIVVSEEVGVWKPDPEIFAIALERSEVPASAAVYIGDSAHHDVPGAHAAGLRAVWMNHRGLDWPGARPPDFELRTIGELLQLLGIERRARA
jgi:putative hydrolase of the HAD superfamily